MASSAVVLRTKGDFKNVTKYLRMDNKREKIRAILEEYGKRGVEQLANATPVDSGLTKDSWEYKISISNTSQTASLSFWNTNVQYPVGTHVGKSGKIVSGKSAPIALILQYGHKTGTGGWVEGRDYLNPVLQPLFDEIATEVWKEVTAV